MLAGESVPTRNSSPHLNLNAHYMAIPIPMAVGGKEILFPPPRRWAVMWKMLLILIPARVTMRIGKISHGEATMKRRSRLFFPTSLRISLVVVVLVVAVVVVLVVVVVVVEQQFLTPPYLMMKI